MREEVAVLGRQDRVDEHLRNLVEADERPVLHLLVEDGADELRLEHDVGERRRRRRRASAPRRAAPRSRSRPGCPASAPRRSRASFRVTAMRARTCAYWPGADRRFRDLDVAKAREPAHHVVGRSVSPGLTSPTRPSRGASEGPPPAVHRARHDAGKIEDHDQPGDEKERERRSDEEKHGVRDAAQALVPGAKNRRDAPADHARGLRHLLRGLRHLLLRGAQGNPEIHAGSLAKPPADATIPRAGNDVPSRQGPRGVLTPGASAFRSPS